MSLQASYQADEKARSCETMTPCVFVCVCGWVWVWVSTGLRLERGCAPVALHHPMAWVPSRDEPLPVSHDHDVPVEGE